MVDAAILTYRWVGLRPTHPSQRYLLCLRCFLIVNLTQGRELLGSLGLPSLFLARNTSACVVEWLIRLSGEEMARGDFKAMLGMSDWGATDALGALVKRGLLKSDSSQGMGCFGRL